MYFNKNNHGKDYKLSNEEIVIIKSKVADNGGPMKCIVTDVIEDGFMFTHDNYKNLCKRKTISKREYDYFNSKLDLNFILVKKAI